MSEPLTVRAEGLRMVFNRRVIFDGVHFTLGATQTLLISGRNGAGKSTLIKIIAGLLTPAAGSLKFSGEQGIFVRQSLVGLVAPYLSLYDEFSAEENLQHITAMRGLPYDRDRAHDLLRRVALFSRKDDAVHTYSSGMKQRAKYAAALLHAPPVLLLDEPMANLDGDGTATVRAIMDEHRREGLLIVATNETGDVDRCDERVDLNALR